jgi:S1-C subfamily serine protease
VGAAPGAASAEADGTFRLESVAPGSVVVSAVLAGAGRGRSEPITVEGGRTTDGVEIRLEPEGAGKDSAATGGVAITLSEAGDGTASVLVAEVATGSEAEHAGLLAGDTVLSIDRAPAASLEAVRRKLEGPEGVDVVLEISRGGQPRTLRVRRERVRR